MISSWIKIHAWLEMYRYAAIGIAGRFFYLVVLIAPLWIGGLWAIEFVGFVDTYTPADVQNLILGLPLVIIGTFLGLRIIASEISGRSLEIVYTVPGGCERVWWTKLTAALFMLLPLGGLLAVFGRIFLTEIPILSIQGAFQVGLFFMVLAMGFAALFRSEVGGAVGTVIVLILSWLIGGPNDNQNVVSPFYNPMGALNIDLDQLIANTVRNRIAYILVSFAILGLAFMRSNRRERLLSG